MPPSVKNPLLASLLVVLAVVLLLLAAGERVRSLLGVSLQLSLGSAAIATSLGAVLAVIIAKTDLPGRRLLGLLIGGLLLMPLYLHAAAWQAGFGALGWATQATAGTGPIEPLLDGFAGAVWAHAMAAVPWTTLIIAATLLGVSREHEESAMLETNPASVLRQVTLRRSAAGVAVAALWVGVGCAAEMTVTDLFNVRTFAEETYTQASLGLFNPRTTTDPMLPLGGIGLFCGCGLLVLVATLVMVIGARLLREPNDQESSGQWRWRLGSQRMLVAPLAIGLLVLVAGLPLANLAYQAGIQVDAAPEGWRRSWSAAKLASMVATAPWEHRRELSISLQLGAVVATTATLIGSTAAWWLSCFRAGRTLAIALLAAGLIVPGPLMGVVTIRMLNQPPDSLLAGLTWLYDDTLFAPWLVQTLRTVPLTTLLLWSAFASIPREILDTAASEGAKGWAIWLRVALPMRWPPLLAAWIIGLATSIGELGATVLVLPPGPQTVTVRIFSLLHYGVEDRVASLCLVMVAGYLLAGLVAAWLLTGGRSPRRFFAIE